MGGSRTTSHHAAATTSRDIWEEISFPLASLSSGLRWERPSPSGPRGIGGGGGGTERTSAEGYSAGNVRRQRPVDAERGGKRSRIERSKCSPIVWDYEEKQARPSFLSSVVGASSASHISQFGGAKPYETLLVQSSAGLQVLSIPPSNFNQIISPPSKPPSSSRATRPCSPRRAQGGLSSSHQVSTPSPIFKKQTLLSPSITESNKEVDTLGIQMQEQILASQMSDDEPVPRQLLPDLDDSPVITLASSRWARETDTPRQETPPRASGRKVRKHSSSSESDKSRVSSGQDGTHFRTGPSTSPELGEYTPPFAEDTCCNSDGIEGQDTSGTDRHSISIGAEIGPDIDGVPPQRSGPDLQGIDVLQGCRSVNEFEKLNRISEGTYGVVYQARNRKTGEIVALKKFKTEKDKKGLPQTSLREIKVLLSLHHRSVVGIKEVVIGSTVDSIFMVLEYMEHDLKGVLKAMERPFSQSEVKCLMLQLLEGVKYIHDNWVLHRDLKTSNLLLNNHGELKICDFGMARQYGSSAKAYTHKVVTLWYRAPELLLGAQNYSTAIDMWSLGCIMAELLAKAPLFNGKSEIDQIDKIYKILGTPNEKIWPEFVHLPGANCKFVQQPYNRLKERFQALSKSGFDLLNRLLTYDPQRRITADEALKHNWFREFPLPESRKSMPK